MSEKVKFPIETIKEGNKITKICVEDYYKVLNRIGRAEERSAEKWNEIWDDVEKNITCDDEDIQGCFVVGRGVSQPNIKDAFDEEIGSNIAFMKAKLNANMKKRNVLFKLRDAAMITVDSIDEEITKINNLIKKDIVGMRRYNSEYLNKLDEFGYEIQEKA